VMKRDDWGADVIGRLLLPKEAAAFLKCKPETLRAWRKRGLGPAYTKIGRLVRYGFADLLNWARIRRVEPANQIPLENVEPPHPSRPTLGRKNEHTNQDAEGYRGES